MMMPLHEWMVQAADVVISAGRGAGSSSALLEQVLADEARLIPSAAEIFDAFAYPGREALRSHLEQILEIVAPPHSRLASELHPGDLILRRAEGGSGHLAMLVTGEMLSQEEMAARGVKPESTRSGCYAEVIEGGVFPHDLEDHFARRIGNEHGQLNYDSLLLRLRHPDPHLRRSPFRDATGVELLEQSSLSLTGPTAIRRGTPGNYEVMNAPQGATFSNWRFVGGGVTWQRPENNNVANWQGTMVQGGTISVDVRIGGTSQTLSRVVVVTPRPWTENAPQVPLGRAGHGNLPTQPRLGLPGRDPRDPGLGTSDTPERHTIQTRIVGSGPNEGFNYLAVPSVTWTPQAFSNNALYDPTHPFFRAHDPSRRGLPLPGNRPQIGQIQMNVEAHEGIIAPPPQAPAGYASHWQMLLNHLANPGHAINIPLERDVSHRSRETNAQYGVRLLRFLSARVTAAQIASRPHPRAIFPGIPYFNYPYIHSRSLRLLVNGASGRLQLTNPAGGTTWNSANPAIASVNATGVVRPVAQGRTTIRVTNADGDIDEIQVDVVP